MRCLENYIGVEGCTGLPTPLSGRYINRRAGINTDMLQKMKDEDKTFVDLWKKIEARAIDAFYDDVLMMMQPNFETISIKESVESSTYSDDNIVVPKKNVIRGVMIETWESPNLVLFVNTIKLFSQEAENNITININDADTGFPLGSIQTDLVKGHNLIEVNQKYVVFGENKKVAFSYDGNTVATRKTELYDLSGYSDSDGFEIPVGEQIVEENMDKISSTSGMIINYNINCDVEELICKRLSSFANAFELKLASEVAFERMHNKTINEYTLFGSEEAEELFNKYVEDYKMAIDVKVQKMPMNYDNVCFVCQRPYYKKVSLP